jgi:N-acetylneuraminate lyase
VTNTFQGAWPALITPTAPSGGVNFQVLRDLTEYLIGKGSGGLYVCGSTGEGLLLTAEERTQVTEEVLDQARGRVPVIAHVGAVSTRQACELAAHAQRVGAAGISAILPTVGDGLRSTYLHYEAIAAAAPALPFYPYLFGGQTDAVSLMTELQRRIPNVAGAKYTGPSMFDVRRLVELGGQRQANGLARSETGQSGGLTEGGAGWTIFSGMDEQCIYGAMSGAPANIGSTLNPMPGAYREIRRRFAAGDLAGANELQLRVNRVTAALIGAGFMGALREAMRMLGFDCGEPRLPLLPLAGEKRELLHSQLAAVNFAEIAAM